MNRVVVTGIGVVSPAGNDAQSFWENITQGKNGISEITKFDTTDYKVKLAGEVTDFDPTLYMEKRDIRKIDLYAQFAIAAATQAVEDSGILGMDENRLGVYIGSGIGGLTTLVAEDKKLMENGPNRISPFLIPMMISNLAAGNVAIKFKAKGPCLPVVTACATSTNEIGEAYRAIKHGYADAIIAGGCEASITELAVAGFTNCMALSTNPDKNTACRPFDKDRNGFVMGEGAGVIILEEYEHARSRGAKIYAEMIGYGNTCDAFHVTAPQPDAAGAIMAIKQALVDADIKDYQKVYVNAHGTSTPLNDKTETVALKGVFLDHAKDIKISSTKSMTGHMLGAAGAVEAVASVLAIKNGVVPPTIGYTTPDPDCDLDYTPNVAKQADIDYALSISLGFGGHNGCVAFRKLGE